MLHANYNKMARIDADALTGLASLADLDLTGNTPLACTGTTDRHAYDNASTYYLLQGR